MKSGRLENIIVQARQLIVNELWVFLTRIYRKKVALSSQPLMLTEPTIVFMKTIKSDFSANLTGTNWLISTNCFLKDHPICCNSQMLKVKYKP